MNDAERMSGTLNKIRYVLLSGRKTDDIYVTGITFKSRQGCIPCSKRDISDVMMM